MIKATLVRSACLRAAIAVFAFGGAYAYAAEVPQVIVEATAPVHVEKATAGAPSAARVDLLSVKYHVHVEGLDLTKHADVVQLQNEIQVAAKKACASIKEQYPMNSLTDEQSCVTDATKKGMAQAQTLIAAAEKNAKK